MMPLAQFAHLRAGAAVSAVVTAPAAVGADSTVYDPPFTTTSTSSFSIELAGTWSTTGNTTNQSGDWVSPKSGTVGDAYEVRLTKASGTDPTGAALATWLPLSTSRSWTLSVGNTSASFTGTLEIRPAGGGAVLSTGSVTLDASCL